MILKFIFPLAILYLGESALFRPGSPWRRTGPGRWSLPLNLFRRLGLQENASPIGSTQQVRADEVNPSACSSLVRVSRAARACCTSSQSVSRKTSWIKGAQLLTV